MCRSACSAPRSAGASCARYETPTRKLPIDSVGLVLLFVWVGALQVMLDHGKDLDWFNSNKLIVALAIVTVLGLAAWIIWELTEEHPIVDLSLFKSRNFALGTLALCLGYAVFFGNVVLMPLWLQTQLGYTATWAGLVAAPSGVTAVLVAPFVGTLHRANTIARAFATASFVIFAHLLLHARGLPARCELLGVRRAAARTGCGHGHVLRGADHDLPRSAAARARAGRLRSQQLPAHHQRQFCHFAHNHLLGPARGTASVAAGGVAVRL